MRQGNVGENCVAAMKFEISSFYSSAGIFQARGPGKVLLFHPPLDGPVCVRI